MIVKLSAQQVLGAVKVGWDRQRHAVEKGVVQYWEREMTPTEKVFHSIYGAVGECAVAHLLNIPWPARIAQDDFNGAGDVGGTIEVRTRHVPGAGVDLGIRPIDKPEKPYVLVHFFTRLSVIDVIGWDYGSEGPKHGKWNETSGCWYLPPPYRSVESLIEQFGVSVAA